MKTKMKKLIVATIALLAVGSGVIIANQVNEEVNAETSTETIGELNLNSNEIYAKGHALNLGGLDSLVIYQDTNLIYALQKEGATVNQYYSDATNIIDAKAAENQDSKGQKATNMKIRMPLADDLKKVETGLKKNSSIADNILYSGVKETKSYWVNTDIEAGITKANVTSTGMFSPEWTATNVPTYEVCKDERTYHGLRIDEMTIQSKTATEKVKITNSTNGVADLHQVYASSGSGGGTVPGKYFTRVNPETFECDPTSALNQGEEVSEGLGYWVKKGNPAPAVPPQDSKWRMAAYYTRIGAGQTQKGATTIGGQYAVLCIQPTNKMASLYEGYGGSIEHYVTELPTARTCAQKQYSADTATARTLIEADLSSVIFASANKDTTSTLSKTNFMTTDGPYLTAQDSGLKAAQVMDTGLYNEGYLVSENQIIIPDTKIEDDGMITIPVDFKDSEYEKKDGFTSDHAMVVVAKNKKTDTTYYGRLAPSSESATDGNGVMYAQFSVNDIVGRNDGKLNPTELEVSIYNNELISTGSTGDSTYNDKYLDFVSDPLTLTVFIGNPQLMEWDDIDNIDKALLPGETVNLTARLSSLSTGWDTKSEFELVNKTELEKLFTVEEKTSESYTSTPKDPTLAFTGENGQKPYTLTLRDDAVFMDGDEVTIKVKKLTTNPTEYSESDELTYALKLYHHMTTFDITPMIADDTTFTSTYSSVANDTQLMKITPDTGMPGEYTYSLVGDEAITKLFKIEPGDATACGTNEDTTVKDCAVVSATQMIDYSAEKYPFTIKVENNVADATTTPVTYSDTASIDSGYTITQRELKIKPTLNPDVASIQYGDTLPTIGYAAVDGTSILDADKDSFGKFSTHYVNENGETVEIATAPAGDYTLVFDQFSADGEKKRFENYNVIEKQTTSLKVELGDSSDLYIDPSISVTYGDNSYTYTDKAGKQQTSDLTLHAQGGTCGVDKSTTCTYTYEVIAGDDIVEITDANTGAFKIKKAGTATIKITKPADGYFKEATKEVTLTVGRRPLHIVAGDQTFGPTDLELPSNDIKFTDDTSLAYEEKVSDFTWSYTYYSAGSDQVVTPEDILKRDNGITTYDILPLMAQTDNGPLTSNYDITYSQNYGKLYVTEEEIDNAKKDEFYKVDEIPSYNWYNKSDNLGIYPINPAYSEMRVYIQTSADSMTIVRDYSADDYRVDKNLCNDKECTFVLKFRNPNSHAVTTALIEKLPIDNVLPEIKELTWESKPDTLAFLYSMFDSEYNTPAMLTVSANDTTSGILDYSYVITEVDRNGKPNGLTTKKTNVKDSTLKLSDKGYYKVDVTVRDEAHNTSTVKTTYVAIDDGLPLGPTVEATVNNEPWDTTAWSKEDITLKLTASDKTEEGEYHGEVKHYEVKAPSNTDFKQIDGDTYTTNQEEINGEEPYKFRAVYKNGAISKETSINLLVDKKAHTFTASAKETIEENVVKSMEFELKLDGAHVSKESWYVYLAETGKSDGAWEPITLSEDSKWTLRENFKGRVYFKNISEARVSTEDSLENLTPVPNKEIEVQDDTYLKVTATSEDKAYRGDWTNKGITLKVSGGAASSSDIKTYAFSTDGGNTWTEILDMTDVAGQLIHQGNDTITLMGAQEINTDIKFKAIYVDSNHPDSEIKSVHVQYDGIAPIVELSRTPEDEFKSTASVKIIANIKDEESSSPVKRYSFDGGKTWTEAGTEISQTFDEVVKGQVWVEDACGNRTIANFAISNINTSKPAVPVVVNGDLYITGIDNWYNLKQVLEVKSSTEGDIYYRINGGQDAKYDETTKIEVTQAGRNTVEVWVQGFNGLSSDVISLDVNLDFTNPKDLKINYTQGNLFEQLENLVTGKKIYVEISGEDDLSGVGQIQYQVVKKDGVYNEANWKNGSKFPMEEDFDGYIYARVIDKAGNRIETVEADRATVTIDGTGPIITTMQDMNSWGTAKTAQVKVEDALSGSNGKLSYKFGNSEDDGAYTTVSLSDGNFAVPLIDGDQNLYLMAEDKVGNVTKKTVKLMIDQEPITIEPNYSGTTATFTIKTGVSGLKEFYVMSSNGVREQITFENKDGSYQASYTFKVNDLYQFTAVNNAGVTTSTESQMISNITATKPVLGVVSTYNEGTWTGNDVTLKASVLNQIKDATLEYKTDNDVWKPYEEGTVLTEGREGISTYSFIANRGTDTQSEVVNFTVKIDKSAPAAPIILNKDSYGEAIWHNASTKVQAKKQITSGCAEELYYSLDAGKQWTKADNYTFLTEGQYDIMFQSVDELGRFSDTAQAIVNIDTTAPSNFAINVNQDQFKELINYITFGLFYNENVNVDFEADYAISGVGPTYYYVSDKALNSLEVIELANQPAKWTQGDHFSITTDFKGVIYARTTDLAGNSTGIISSDGLEVKFTGAILNASNRNGNGWGSDDEVTISSSDFETIETLSYVINTPSPTGGTLSFDENGKAVLPLHDNGQYSVTFTALDKFGNTSTAKINTKIDNVAPTVSIEQNTEQSTEDVAVLKISGNAGASGIQSVYLINEETGERQYVRFDSTNSFTYKKAKNGTYKAELTNGAGVMAEASVKVTSLSENVPEVVVSAISNGITYVDNTWTTSSVELAIREANSLPGTTFEYRDITTNADVGWTALSANPMTVSQDGVHHYQFRAITNGKTSEHKDFTVKISSGKDIPEDFVPTVKDEDKEKVTEDKGSNTPVNKEDVTITPEVPTVPTDDTPELKRWVEYKIDAGEWQTSLPIVVTGEGRHEVNLHTKDELGRITKEKTYYVIIDTTAPTNLAIKLEDNTFKVFINNVTFGTFYKDNKQAEISAKDEITGVAEYQYQIVREGETFNIDGSWESIPVPAVTTYATASNTVTLEKGFKGVVYARAIDHAGNVSNVISTDGIIIDYLSPNIQMKHDMSDWAEDTGIHVTLSDDLSGVREAKYSVYKRESGVAGTDPVETGVMQVENQKGVITGFDNGEYKVEVIALDRSGNEQKNNTVIKVDNQAPTIRSEVTADETDLSYKTITSTVTAPVSGIKDVRMSSDKLGTSILNADGNGSYPYKVYAAGTYTFTVTANNGKTATSTITIGDGEIINTKPVIGLKGEYIVDGSEYISDTWGFDGIRLIASNLVSDLENMTFQYYIDESGNAAPNESTTWIDSEDGILRAYTDGTYYVRGIIKDKDGDTAKDIVGEPTAFIVKLDLTGPRPVTIKDPENFTMDTWHEEKKDVAATFEKDTQGADEWVEYSIDGGAWTKLAPASSVGAELSYSVSVGEDGTHTVKYRSVDEAGRMSLETTAYVNIDTATTGKDTLKLSANLRNKESDAYRDIVLTPVVGASGIKEIAFDGFSNSNKEVITPNEDGQYIYRAKVNETYKFTLISGNGKKATAEIKVDSITNADPIVNVVVTGKEIPNQPYKDLDKWIGETVTLTATDANPANAGVVTPYTTEFFLKTGDIFSDVPTANTVNITATGIYTYKVVMSYTDAEGTVHTGETEVSVKVDVDPVKEIQKIVDADRFGSDKWIGASSNITDIKAIFEPHTTGCEEWAEISMDNVNWVKGTGDSVTRTLEDLPDGTYTFYFRTNDELDTGKLQTQKEIVVQIDRSSGKLFHVEYQKSSGTFNFLRSLITKENYEFKFDGNFDISQLDHIDYRILNDGEQFNTNHPKFDSTLTDISKTIPVQGPTFNGKICGQATDKAGNKTIIACSDPLLVDQDTPSIDVSSGSILPDGGDDNWFGVRNNATVTINTLPFSGFKEKSYTLEPLIANGDTEDKRETIQGELNFVNANDKITSQITNIPDGKWNLIVTVTSNTGASVTVKKKLHVDATEPTLVAEEWDKGTVVEDFDMILIPTVGVSGIDKIELVSALDTYGAPIDGYTPNTEIQADNGVYKLNITENGKYSFKITAKNGKASYLRNVEVTNIKIEEPQLIAKAVTYSEKDGAKEVASDTWAPDRIELTFSLGNQDKIHEQVIWQYRNNNDENSVWKDVIGKESNDRTNKFSFDDDGIYDYSFRAVAGQLVSETYHYIAKIDTSGPSAPTINETGLEENVWHNSEQNVSASFVKDPNGGCNEFIEFRTYTKDEDGNETVVSDWAQGDHLIVKAEGKTYVDFRTYDELNRSSTTATAIVVIDSFAPDNMSMSYAKNTIKQWLNTISFGNFYKDYVDVTFTATDEGDATGTSLTYYYVLVDKADVDAFDPYAKDTAWIEATTNPISIAPNWEGLVYAKAKDKAGNETIVIRSDGISIDNVEPDIVFTPASYPTWSDSNSLGIHVSDDQAGAVHSGLNIDKITWSNNLTDKAVAVSGKELSLDADGNATLLDLADGKYQITVNAEDIAGNAYSRSINVKYDSVVPTLAMEPVDVSKTVYKETITLVPTVGGSGIKEFHVWKDGMESDLEIVTKIVNGKEVRTVDIVKNGFYEFSFTSGSNKESNKVSIQIENISDETPYIIAKGMTGTDTYTKGTWTDQNVELTVTTKLPDLYGLDLYYHVTKNGIEITPTADDVTMEYKGITWIKFDGHLSVMDDGDYLYQFIGRSPSGKTSNPAVKFPVKIDHSSIPDVIVEKEAEYVSDAWFATAQNIKADFVDPNPEVRKVIEYNLDGEKEYGKDTLNWREGDQLGISANGKHTVIFRVRSDFGKVGSEKTIYVNIDRLTPSFTYQVAPKDGSARISFTPTIGVSGTKSFTLTDSQGHETPIINNMITVNQTGTYKATLTSNAGLSYSQDIEVKALSEIEPILDVVLSDHDGNDRYFKDSGLWEATSSKWAEHAIDIEATVTNADVTGDVKILVNVDNTGWVEHVNKRTWSAVVGDSPNFEGGYHYDIKAVSESGMESETLSFDAYVDKTKPGGFSIKDTTVDPANSSDPNSANLIYKEGNWQNTSQRITTDFKQSAGGSSEWTAFTITRTDGGKNEVIATQERGNYYDINESGIYTVKVESMDELGRVGVSKSFEVRIDKERPSDLEVSVETNTFKSYLKKLTMGLFFKDTIEINASVNYGMSSDGSIYLQIVDDETQYDNDANSQKWDEHKGDKATITVDETMIDSTTQNFHKIIYFYAKDIAGNRTDVYRTDGITVDKVAPSIDITIPNEGSWTSDNTVEISGSDANAIDAVKDLSGGLKEITYETDSTPVQSGKVQLDQNNKNTLTLADGTYDITVEAIDYAGNDAKKSKTVHIDTVAPTIEVTGHNDGVLAGSEILTIHATVGVSDYQKMNPSGVADNTGTAIIHVSATTTDTDGKKVTTTSALNESETYTVTQNGVYIFTVTNQAGVSASQTITVNNISQEVSTLKIMMTHDDGNGNQVIIDHDTWSATPVNIKTTTDMVSTIQYKVKSSDGKSTNWTNAEDGKLTIAKDGTHTVSIRAVSASGTVSKEEQRIVKIDTEEPKDPMIIDIDDYDGWFSKARTVTAVFDEDVNGCAEWIQYSLNGGTWTDGDQVTITQPGVSNVAFRVMDELGRSTSGSLSSAEVKLDLSAPTGVKVELKNNDISKVLNAMTFGNYYKETQDVYASANFSDSGVGYFEYQIVNKGDTFDDSTNWKRKSLSGKEMNQSSIVATLTSGFEGTVYVRAVDAAGNVSAIANTNNVAIDDQAPVITMPILADGEWLHDNNIAISITDDQSGVDWDSVTYSYKKGSKTFTGKVSVSEDGKTVFLPPLENGEYDLSVTAADKAGNSATNTAHIRLDTIKARIIDVTLDPENVSTDKVLIKAKIEDKSISGLDKVTIVSKTINETEMTPVDGEPGWYSFMATTNATYTIKATTKAGLVSTRDVEIANIENSNPVLKITSVYTQDDKKNQPYTSGEWANANIDVTVANVAADIDVKEYYYRIEDLAGQELRATQTIDSTNGIFLQEIDLEGTYKVIFWCISEGGRPSDNVELLVNIDRSAPNVPSVTDADTYGIDDWTNSPVGRDVEATFEPTNGAPEWIEYNINDEWTTEHELYWRKVPANGIVNVNIEGTNKLIFRTVDATGRISSSTNEAYVNIDTTAPSDFFIKVEEKEYRKLINDLTFGAFFKDTVEVTIDGNFDISGLDRIEYQVLNVGDKLDVDGDWKDYDGHFYISNDSSKVVYARGYDKAGNVTSIIRSDDITVETDAPIITYPDYTDNNTNGWITDNWLNVNVTDKISEDKAFSGVKEVTYTSFKGLDDLKGKADFLNDDAYLISNLPDGSYYLNILAQDQAGNEAHSYFGVAIDTKKPSFSITGDRKTPATSVTLKVLEKDIHVGASGVKEIKVNFNEGDGTPVEQILKVDADGNYPFIAYENTEYTFTLTNGANVSTTRKVVITNIGEAETGIYVSENVVENTWIKAESFSFDVWSEPRTNFLRYRMARNEETSGDYTDINDSTKQIQLDESGKYSFDFETYDPSSTETVKPMLISRNVRLWIDGDTPNAPVVIGTYDDNTWYSGTQRVRAENRNTIVASDETIQYKVDDASEWTSGDSVEISDFGKHHVYFRIIDEVGHVSEITTASVNISDPSGLSMRIIAENTTITSSAKMTIWPTLAQAPIDKLTVRNMDSADSSYHELDVRSVRKNYSYFVTENGRYEVILTDKAGSKAIQYVDFYNIQTAETKLIVTMKDSNNVTIKDNAWSGSAVTITAKDPSDETLALSKITYTVGDDTTPHVYAKPIKVSESGIQEYHFTLSRNGETIETKTVQAKIDMETPLKPTIKNANRYGDAVWSKEDLVKVQGELDTSSPTPGSVEKLRYRVDDGEWINGEIARVRGDGEHTVTFVTYDEVGHISAETSVKVNIDKVVPNIVSIDKSEDKAHNTNLITITANDNHGVAKIYYKLVEQGVKEDTISYSESAGDEAVFEIQTNFKGKIYAYAMDLAGNVSPVRVSDLINIDYSIPVITLPADHTEYTKDNTLSVSVNSGDSPLDPTSLKWVAKVTPTGKELASGIFQVDDFGRGKIEGLPNGSYRVYVSAANTAGNVGTNDTAVLIENYTTTITPTIGELSVDKRTQQILIEVTYGDDANPALTSNLRPDKLYVKEGAIGEWIEVESYNAGLGKGTYNVNRNGIYTFKAVHSATQTNTISDPVTITAIEKGDGDIALDDYIKFAAPEDKGCGLAVDAVNTDGTCTFTNYKNVTVNDVTILVLNWDKLNAAMSKENLRLVQRIKLNNNPYPSEYEDVTWGEDTVISGAKVITSYRAADHYGESYSYQFALMNEQDEIVGTDIVRRFGFSVTAGGDGRQKTLLMSNTDSDVLRMSAYTPMKVDEGMSYQIVEGTAAYDPNGWSESGEEIALGKGAYTLYTREVNGEIKTKELNVSDETIVSAMTSNDPIRSFLKAITFNLLYQEDMEVKLETTKELTNIEYNMSGTWNTYEGAIYIPREFTGEILVRAQGADGTIVETLHLN